MSTYFCILTEAGQAAVANAVALNQDVQLSEMAVGDGNGNPITPQADMTTLVNEVYRAGVNTIGVDAQDPGHVIAELVIPTNQGGWTIRECGLFDADGNLFAVGSLPASAKPAVGEGAGAELTVRMHLTMTAAQAEAIELKIDPTIVLASRQYVDAGITAHDEDTAAHADLFAGAAVRYETDYIDASAFTPSADGDAPAGVIETAVNGQKFPCRDFGHEADSAIQISYPMTENWDRGDIKAKILWAPGDGAVAGDDVVFILNGAALSDGDDMDVAFVTGAGLADQVAAAGKVHISAASAALTIEGNPALGDFIHFELTRDVSEGVTPMAAACRVIGLWIQYTCNQPVAAW